MRPRRSEKQIFKFTHNLIPGRPSLEALPYGAALYDGSSCRRLAFRALARLSRPSETEHHLLCPACLLSSILHYPTDDLSDRRPPPADSCCQPSVRIKPATLFIFILLPFPSSVFFLKIVCQHCSLSCTQWSKQCLLN